MGGRNKLEAEKGSKGRPFTVAFDIPPWTATSQGVTVDLPMTDTLPGTHVDAGSQITPDILARLSADSRRCIENLLRYEAPPLPESVLFISDGIQDD